MTIEAPRKGQDPAAAFLIMSEDLQKQKMLIEEAAGIVAASHNKVGITQAMGLVGFSEDDRKKMNLYQKVRRRAQKLSVVEKKNKEATPPSQVDVGLSSQVSTLSSDETSNRRRRVRLSADRQERRVRRRILNAEEGNITNSPDSTGISSVDDILTSTGTTGKCSSEKKSRRSPKEVQRANAMVIMQTQRDKEAMKQATTLIKRNSKLSKTDPSRKNVARIVEEVNKRMDSNITAKTAS